MLHAQRVAMIAADTQRLRRLGYDPDYLTNPYAQSAYREYYRQALAGEFDHLSLFVKPDAISIDVGANSGRYTIKLAATSRACLALEPVGSLAPLGDALPANCSFRSTAAGAQHGHGTLKIPLLSNGTVWDGGSTLTDTIALGITTFVEQATLIETIDALVADYFPHEDIGFIKIDVEGAECDVLVGCTATLARWQPNLQVEIWRDAVPQTTAVLQDYGYIGLFFFQGLLHTISQFNPAVHCADAHAWRPDRPYDLQCYVDNFFFIPIQSISQLS